MSALEVAPPTPLLAKSRADWRAEIELATELDALKDLADKAEALRRYAKAAKLAFAKQNEFAEYKLRCQRRGGVLLTEAPRGTGGRGKTSPSVGEVYGLGHSQASRWQHLARIPEPDFEFYLQTCLTEAKEITTAAALKLAKRLAAADKPDVDPPTYQPIGEIAEFPCIVIDPPWRYDNVATRGAAEDHYPTMSLDELSGAVPLPDPTKDDGSPLLDGEGNPVHFNREVASLAAADAHLYLWVTNGFLREGFDLMAAWGFTYKACLTWCKPQIGMGNYFRNNTEHVLFGLKGRLPTLANDVPTWFVADRKRHSAKPECFYDLVEKSSPGPFMEMFARTRRFGWHTWGNEA